MVRVPDVRGALRSREAQAQVAADGESSLTRLSFFIKTLDPGQTLYDIQFPVQFTEEPDITYSYKCEEGTVLGLEYPEARAGVFKFAFDEIAVGVRYYKGATMILKVTCDEGQSLVIHLIFTGIALSGPTAPEGGLT